jgi:hypothetical protein
VAPSTPGAGTAIVQETANDGPWDVATLRMLVASLQCGDTCVETVNQPCPTPCTTLVYLFPCGAGQGAPSGSPPQDSDERVVSDCLDDEKIVAKPNVPWGDVDSCDDLAITIVRC